MFPKAFTLSFFIGLAVLLLYMTLTQKAKNHINEVESKKSGIVYQQMREDFLKSDFVEVTQAINHVKYKQLNYRDKNGSFTRKLSALGLDDGEIVPNHIKKIILKRHGRIRVELDNKFGEDIIILYNPIDRIVKSDEMLNEWNDARTPEYLLDEVKVERSFRNRRTKWKCRTNFSIKMNWCKFVENLK